MSDMAHFFGAKERQSFVAYSLRTYGYVYDTKVDPFLFYLTQDFLFHLKLMLN
jgi:hypothetical protein